MYSQNGYQPPQETYSNNWAPQEEVYKTSAKRERTPTTTSLTWSREGHDQGLKAQPSLLPYRSRQPKGAGPDYRTTIQFLVPLHC